MTEQQVDDLQRKLIADLRKLVNSVSVGLLGFLDKIVQESTIPAASIESEYGKPFAELGRPPGFAWKRGEDRKPEFRVPKNGERFLRSRNDDPEGRFTVGEGSMRGDSRVPDTPRLILVRCRRLVLDIVDEGRSPKSGEWAQREDGAPIYPHHTVATGMVWHHILSAPRIEE